MINNYNVIGDIAGNMLTLKALLAKMPQDAEPLALGDLNDRGPRSREVIEFFMANGKSTNSNHGHMMVEAWKNHMMPGAHVPYYEIGLWLNYNGGSATMRGYESKYENIPKSHITFLENLPMYIESENFVMTHAPLAQGKTLKEASDLGDGFFNINHDPKSNLSLIWNRYVPNKVNSNLNSKINVFGHNSSDKVKIYCTQYPCGFKVTNETLQNYLKEFGKGDIWGICLDTSSAKILSGLHLPSMTLYQQEYID